jgi:RNA polymerase sigma factor (TIGR02999 family)
MQHITEILCHLEQDRSTATRELFQLVYADLRKLAEQKMAQESPSHTLQPTALVHDAFIRLIDVDNPQAWQHRGHFYAAAAEAMRRILIEAARRKLANKRGGDLKKIPIDDLDLGEESLHERLVEIDDALARLAEEDAIAAELVKLRLFAGLSITEAGQYLGLPRSTAYDNWKYARAWFAMRGDWKFD